MSANGLPLVSVVIPTHNRKKKVSRLIASLLASTYPLSKIEIIVLDDASTDGTCKEIRGTFTASNVKVIRCFQEKLVAECRNIGIENSEGEYVFFVDDDVVVDRTTISGLVKFMQRNEDVGVVGPIILYLNAPNVVWCAGIKINFWTTLGKFIGRNETIERFKYPITCNAVPTAFMVHRSVATKFRFNSKLFPIQYEEIDFCIRINRFGYKVVVVPCAIVWHERPTATFLRNPLRAYFDARNGLIGHKLWSVNYMQYVTSLMVNLAIPLLYLIVSMRFATNYTKTLKAILKGLTDGLRLSLMLDKPAIYNGSSSKNMQQFDTF